MEAKHTPGPWDYHSGGMEWNGMHRVVQRVISTHGMTAPHLQATIAAVPCDTDTDNANTLLIAAAPDMYEALVACADRLSAWSDRARMEANDGLRPLQEQRSAANIVANYSAILGPMLAAIAKTEGR